MNLAAVLLVTLARITFTASGDDSTVGRVAGYVVQSIYETGEVTYSNGLGPTGGAPVIVMPGLTQELYLEPGPKTFAARVAAVDEIGNWARKWSNPVLIRAAAIPNEPYCALLPVLPAPWCPDSLQLERVPAVNLGGVVSWRGGFADSAGGRLVTNAEHQAMVDSETVCKWAWPGAAAWRKYATCP